MMKFVKMHGLGNDFVVINNTNNSFQPTARAIKQMADRNRGIGFDQLISLEEANYQESKFFYRIYNSDGVEVYQCGNGARCIAKYLWDSALCVSNQLTLATTKDVYAVTITDAGIQVNMGQVITAPAAIPYISSSLEPLLAEHILSHKFAICSFGNPHAVTIVEELTDSAVAEIGAKVTKHKNFPEGVNVGFMQVVSPKYIKLRVYERGVGETLACGSGACAAVVLGQLQQVLAKEVTVELPGGKLLIWQEDDGSTIMQGSANSVFHGNLGDDFFT